MELFKGQRLQTIRGPHKGEIVEVIEAAPGRVFFKPLRAGSRRKTQKRELVVSIRPRFESEHRPLE